MDDPILSAGDVITAAVTRRLPFGVLVEYAGVPGLAKGAHGEPGSKLDLRVLEYDSAQSRFSAELA